MGWTRVSRGEAIGVIRIAGVALLLATLAACGGDGAPEPSETPEPGGQDGGAVSISADCRGPGPLEVPLTSRESEAAETGDDGDDGAGWEPARAAEIADCFELRPEAGSAEDGTDPARLPRDVTFVLESAERFEPAALAGLLRIEPPVGVEVTALGDGAASADKDGDSWSAGRVFGAREARAAEQPHAYRIKPAERLPVGAAVKVSLLGEADGDSVRSWAFAVDAPLRVVSSLPADRATDVPLDAGIELTFNHADVVGLEAAVSIEPAIEGTFERRGSTVVFVPFDELAQNTLYTVRVAQSASTEAGRAMGQPFELAFETGVGRRGEDVRDPAEPPLAFDTRVWDVPTSEAPVVAVRASGGPEQPAGDAVVADVFRYPDEASFGADVDALTAIPSWTWRAQRDWRADPAALEAVRSVETSLEDAGDFGELVVRLGDPLPAGWYLVEVRLAEPPPEAEDQPAQAWVQVTDLAVYVAISETRSVVWVNDAAGGGPLADAAIEIFDSEDVAATTGADGLAVFETPQTLIRTAAFATREIAGEIVSVPERSEVAGTLAIEAADGRRVLVPLAPSLRSGGGFREFMYGGRGSARYASYLYTDRSLYRMGDTVRFWGVIRPRDGATGVEEAVAELYGWSDGGEVVLARTAVDPGAAGTVIGSLAFEGAAPGYYTLRLRAGGDPLADTGIEIRDFVKPAYALDVEPARRAVFAGDTLTASVKAAFFDGTPAPAMRVTAETNGRTVDLVTDAAGRAVWDVPLADAGGDVGGLYETQYLSVRPGLAEASDVGGGAMIQVFPAAAAVRAEGRAADGRGVVSGTLHALDLAPVNASPEAEDTDLAFAEPLAGRPLAAEITEQRWEPIRTGERYDFVRRAVVPTFRYEVVETLVDEREIVTGDDGSFEIGFETERGIGYIVKLTVEDDQGRASQRTVWVGDFGGPDRRGVWMIDESPRDAHAEGDEVTVRLDASDADLIAEGRTLFWTARNGLREAMVSDQPRFVFTFDADHIPNIHVSGVHFTGRTYLEAPFGHNARFDRERRRLSVEVAPGAEGYAPGEAVTLRVDVKDAQGGPAAGAAVLLSAVDEAVVRLSGFRGEDILSALYRDAPAGVMGTAATHKQAAMSGGAEGGGGGGDIRDDLRDTALFEEVVTGADGTAEVTFDLPDNITSWAVQAIAVTGDLRAGDSTARVQVSLPLFVAVSLPEGLLEADRAAIRLRAFGTELEQGDPVAMRVVGDGLAEPLEAEAEAFEVVDLDLGPLPSGRQALTVTVTSGELADGIARSIEVLPSRLVAVEARTVELAADSTSLGLPEVGGDGRVHLTLTDRNRGRYLPDLEAMARSAGDRLDQRMGRAVAEELLSEHFGEPARDGFRPTVYQVPEDSGRLERPGVGAGQEGTSEGAGGLALLPYGSAELPLSAWAAAAAPGALAGRPLAEYFGRALEDADATARRSAWALWGAAAVGEPVLAEVLEAAGDDRLGPVEHLLVGLAAASLGDEATARDRFAAMIAEHGQRRGVAARIAVDGDRAEMIEATWLAAMLAAALSDPLAPALYDYAASNPEPDTVDALQRAAVLERMLPRLDSAAPEVAYTLADRRAERTIEPGGTVRLDLSRRQLDELELEVLSGTVGATLTALVPADLGDRAAAPDPGRGQGLTIERAYAVREASGDAPLEGDEIEIADGDLVLVTLTPSLGVDSDAGCHRVTDLLPSGLRAVTGVYDPLAYYDEEEVIDHPYAIEGQRVSFCVYPDDAAPRPLSYLARTVTPGNFLAEPALIQALLAPEQIAFSGSATVQIAR